MPNFLTKSTSAKFFDQKHLYFNIKNNSIKQIKPLIIVRVQRLYLNNNLSLNEVWPVTKDENVYEIINPFHDDDES